ncbi:hypothetical protein [Paludisphaera mucosa]|uniref:Uncharacterized protein n=1 Tax=Paludisphaera mucosa TaxID=3030827 RepID=A0ABT6FLJ1_9BACT|nr:hypothetical protein [Paludisphaera mucosa]MDG3008230.1 hypothetical protein [Paludisphaera mucosa]
MARDNRVEFQARQGRAGEAELQRVLAENRQIRADLEQIGDGVGAALQAFAQQQARLLQLMQFVNRQQAEQLQWQELPRRGR